MITALCILAFLAVFLIGVALEHRVRLKDGQHWRDKLALESAALSLACSEVDYLNMRVDCLSRQRNDLDGRLTRALVKRDAIAKGCAELANDVKALTRERDQLKSEVETLRRRVEQLRHNNLSTY